MFDLSTADTVRQGDVTAMTEAKDTEPRFVLGKHQIIVGLFLAVTLTGTFCGLAYIAGRVVAPSGTEAAGNTPPVETLAVAASPEAIVEEPAAAGAVSPQLAHPQSEPGFLQASYFRQPEPGQLFLQVAAADPGVAGVFAEYLTRMDFACQIGYVVEFVQF